MIVVDLPPEEDEELCLPALKAGLSFIRLATPTTDDARLPAVLANTSGFVYYVSITGITGAAAAGLFARSATAVKRIKGHTDLPVAVGFGVKDAAAAREIAANADGVVVGSALIDALARTLDAQGRGGARDGGGGRQTGGRTGGGHRQRREGEREPMNWISNVVPPKIRSFLKRDTPENLWVKCPESGALVFHKDLEANLYVVPSSGYHMRIPTKARLDALFDDGAYDRLAAAGSARRSAEIPRHQALHRPDQGLSRQDRRL